MNNETRKRHFLKQRFIRLNHKSQEQDDDLILEHLQNLEQTAAKKY